MRLVVAAVVIVAVFGACRSSDERELSLLVGSAISLQPALDQAIAVYAGPEGLGGITVSYAGSGTIRRQIEYGAPIDVFLSAAPEHIDTLVLHGLVDPSSRTTVASNRLVLIASLQRPPFGSIDDLRLPGVSRIAIGQPEIVPAGRYAFQTPEKAGILASIKEKLIFTKDVQQVLVYVRTGSVDAGFVYASDVLSSTPVRVIGAIADSLHAPIVYEGVVTARSSHPEEAGRFLAFLRSDSVRTLFTTHGFHPPGQ